MKKINLQKIMFLFVVCTIVHTNIYAQAQTICATQSPTNWVTLSDMWRGYNCDNNFPFKYNRYIQYTPSVGAAGVISQCGEAVPAGWVPISWKSFCGEPIQNSAPTQISNNVYQWVSKAVIRRDIFKIEGLWPGYYLNVSGQFPTVGWATVGMLDREFVGQYSFLKRTIVKIDGLWPGYHLNTVGESPSAGWVNIQFGNSVYASDGFMYNRRTTVKIAGMATGTVINSCGDAYGTQIPAGWATIEKNTNCGLQQTGISYYGRTLKNMNGMPVGTQAWFVDDGDPIPAGWQVMSTSFYVPQYAYAVGPFTYYKRLYQKIFNARLASGMSEADALVLENAEVPATAPIQEEGRKPTTEELKKLFKTFKVSVINNPSATNFTLSLDGLLEAKKYSLAVYDLNGKLIETKTINCSGNKALITLGDRYGKGIFIAKISDGEQMVSTKLIKL
jgi:hypothetical protein